MIYRVSAVMALISLLGLMRYTFFHVLNDTVTPLTNMFLKTTRALSNRKSKCLLCIGFSNFCSTLSGETVLLPDVVNRGLKENTGIIR